MKKFILLIIPWSFLSLWSMSYIFQYINWGTPFSYGLSVILSIVIGLLFPLLLTSTATKNKKAWVIFPIMLSLVISTGLITYWAEFYAQYQFFCWVFLWFHLVGCLLIPRLAVESIARELEVSFITVVRKSFVQFLPTLMLAIPWGPILWIISFWLYKMGFPDYLILLAYCIGFVVDILSGLSKMNAQKAVAVLYDVIMTSIVLGIMFHFTSPYMWVIIALNILYVLLVIQSVIRLLIPDRPVVSE